MPLYRLWLGPCRNLRGRTRLNRGNHEIRGPVVRGKEHAGLQIFKIARAGRGRFRTARGCGYRHREKSMFHPIM